MLLAACSATRSEAKDYVATKLPDGTIEIIVSGKTGIPTGGKVGVIDLPSKLKAAAAAECASEFDVTTNGTASLEILPNGKGFGSKLRGIVRCR